MIEGEREGLAAIVGEEKAQQLPEVIGRVQRRLKMSGMTQGILQVRGTAGWEFLGSLVYIKK